MATLSLIDTIRAGKRGELVSFSSCFAQMVDPENHRAGNKIEAESVSDMALYPVNAAHAVFGDEPIEVVSAVGTRHAEAGFSGDFDDTVAVTLRFCRQPDRPVRGQLPCQHDRQLRRARRQGQCVGEPWLHVRHVARARAGGRREEIAPKLQEHRPVRGRARALFRLHPASCILHDRDPKPDGEEGHADVRVLEGIVRALESGQPEMLAPFTRGRQINTADV